MTFSSEPVLRTFVSFFSRTGFTCSQSTDTGLTFHARVAQHECKARRHDSLSIQRLTRKMHLKVFYTSISPSLEHSPMIIPLYTSCCIPVNKTPRGSSSPRACVVVLPSAVHTRSTECKAHSTSTSILDLKRPHLTALPRTHWQATTELHLGVESNNLPAIAMSTPFLTLSRGPL